MGCASDLATNYVCLPWLLHLLFSSLLLLLLPRHLYLFCLQPIIYCLPSLFPPPLLHCLHSRFLPSLLPPLLLPLFPSRLHTALPTALLGVHGVATQSLAEAEQHQPMLSLTEAEQHLPIAAASVPGPAALQWQRLGENNQQEVEPIEKLDRCLSQPPP